MTSTSGTPLHTSFTSQKHHATMHIAILTTAILAAAASASPLPQLNTLSICQTIDRWPNTLPGLFPPPIVCKPIKFNTQACIAEDHIIWLEYVVHVGRPYNDAKGCDYVMKAISDAGPAMTGWLCESDRHNGTLLRFNAAQQGGIDVKVNKGLAAAFPMIEGGFNCPNM